jgi:hypothetical protein
MMDINFPLLNRISMFLRSITLSLSPPEGLEMFLSYLKENPDTLMEADYIEKIYLFFQEQFQLMNKYYIYLTHPSIKMFNGLKEKRDILLSEIEDFLKSFKGEFQEIKQKWEIFFDEFTNIYKERHDGYYQSNIFGIKKEIEESEEGRVLKKISTMVSSIAFPHDWWDIKKGLDALPQRCNENLSYELFSNPICKCGFSMMDEPPPVKTDFLEMCVSGINNFLKILQGHGNKEKFDSYILGIPDSGNRDIAKRLLSLINLNLDNINLPLIFPLITEDVLGEIEKALKGRWKLKEVRADDFIDKIKGRRFKYDELKGIFMEWIGDDYETIIHVKGENNIGIGIIKDDLFKYGARGEQIYMEMDKEGINISSHNEIDDVLKEKGKLQTLSNIKLSSYSLDDLFNFLKTEKIEYLKCKQRTEIFFRLYNKIIPQEMLDNTNDDMMKNLLYIIKLFGEVDRYNGIRLFTGVIAPLSYLYEKIRYENFNEKLVDMDVVQKIETRLDSMLKEYEKMRPEFEGLKDLDFVKNRLEGNVVIFDGLRYDLWSMFKDILEKIGWKIKDTPYRITSPSSTDNFRKLLGIGEENLINNKTYTLLKWSERDVGKRHLKKIINGKEEIKFLHFNFIDAKLHNSTLDLSPLYIAIKGEFINGILPILKEIKPFLLISDHGFSDTKKMKDRYTHSGNSVWETVLPFIEVE